MSEEISQKFVSEALRTPRMDVHQRLAARMLLSASTCQDELQRFMLVVRAAQGMTEECKAQGLELDEGLLTVVDAVARSFQLAKPLILGGEQGSFKVQPIPWCFSMTQENFESYIAEWWDVDLSFYTELLTECKEPWVKVCCSNCGHALVDMTLEDWLSPDEKISEKTEKYGVPPDEVRLSSCCPNCGFDWRNESTWNKTVRAVSYGRNGPTYIIKYYRPVAEPVWRFFFDATANALTLEGYSRLLGNFLSFYSQAIADVGGKVAKSISPTIFREVEAAVAAEKEAAGEAKNENGLG